MPVLLRLIIEMVESLFTRACYGSSSRDSFPTLHMPPPKSGMERNSLDANTRLKGQLSPRPTLLRRPGEERKTPGVVMSTPQTIKFPPARTRHRLLQNRPYRVTSLSIGVVSMLAVNSRKPVAANIHTLCISPT